jgi:hypothetical protein
VILRATELIRPVLVVPGIMGTLPRPELFDQWLTHRGFAPEALVLDPLAHSYDDIVQTLQNAGYIKDQTLFVANYDWRMPPGPQTDGARDGFISGLTGASITDSTYEYGVDYLGYWLKQAVQDWNARHPGVILDSVDVIAHSTGGLITRTYIQSAAYNDAIPGISGATARLPKINNFIMVGVPNRGASKAFNALNDNWNIGLGIGDSLTYVVLSKLIKQAWLKLKGGATITGPTQSDFLQYSDFLFANGDFDFNDFIQTYVPTIRALNATYAFLDNFGSIVDKNNDPEFSNDWLLDLNGGTDPNGFRAKLLADPTVLYSATVDTATTAFAKTGSLEPVLYHFRDSLPEFAGSDETWYDDLKGADGGDGTVPTESSAGPFQDAQGDDLPGFVTYEFDGVSHTGLTGDPRIQRTILAKLGRPFTTTISTNLAVPINIKTGWLVVMGVDPVDAVLVDPNGSRLGFTQASGPIQEIPNSLYLGGADGVGIAFGSNQAPTSLQLTGTGGDYTVFLDGYVQGEARGLTESGNLAAGQTKEFPIDLNPPPPDRPRVLEVSLVDQPSSDRLRVAIDFSVAMDPTTASQVGNYAIGLRDGAGLQVLSATYSDADGHHRVTLEGAATGGGSVAGGTYDVRLKAQSLKSIAGTPMYATSDSAVVLVDDANTLVTIGPTQETGGTGVLNTSSLGTSAPSSFVVRDFDGDGIPDIVTVNAGFVDTGNRGGSMLFLHGLGGGRFGDPVAYPLDPLFAAIKVVAADWDGNGTLDVVLSASKSYYYAPFEETIYIFLNDGKGRFTRAPDTPFETSDTSNFQLPVPSSIEVANVLPGAGPEIIAYKQGYYNNYGGSPQEGEIQIIGKDPFLGYSRLMTVDIGAAMQPSQILHGDLNGDGRDDIVTGDQTGVYVVLTTPTGLAPAVKLAFDGLYSGTLRIGDVNGDGKLDIIDLHEDYSNNADVHDGDIISVFLNNGRGVFTNLPGQIMGRRGSDLAGVADFDQDGRLDLLLTESWDDGPGGYAGYNWPDVPGPSVWVWRGDGKGRFAQPSGMPTLMYTNPSGSSALVLADTGITDLNGDGRPDVLLSNKGTGRIYALIGGVSGELTPSPVPGPYLGAFSPIVDAAAAAYQPIATGDFNRDGLIDVAKRSSYSIDISLGVEGGGFRPFDSFAVNHSYGGAVRSADLNGDGILDLVIDGGNLSILLGRGDGTFDPAFEAESDGASAIPLQLVDVNRDGKMDAIVLLQGGSAGDGFAVFFGDGSGKLVYNPSSFIARAGSGPQNVGDFDGDGKVDILDQSLVGSDLRLLKNRGDGKFIAQPDYAPGQNASRFYAGDLNGDGLPDAIGVGTRAGTTYDEAYVYLNDGAGHLVFSGTTGMYGSIYNVTILDLNGDGANDLVVSVISPIASDSPGATVGIALNDGHGKFTRQPSIDVGGTQSIAGASLAGDTLLAGSIDVVAPPTIQFAAPTSKAEENAGTAAVTVTRAGPTGFAATVDYAVTGGTATRGADFQLADGTLSFAPGEASKDVIVTLLDDQIVEGDETIQLTLSNVTGAGTTLGSPSTAILTIHDNDAVAPSSLKFSEATYSAGEADGKATITVVRTGNLALAATVSYRTADGTATAGSDYVAVSSTLTFSPNEASKTFSVTLHDDTVAEPTETILLTLTNVNGAGASLGSPSSATLKIIDNDARSPVTVLQFSPAKVSVAEAGKTVRLTINRTGDLSRAVGVNYATVNGSATGGSDYLAVAGTLAFEPNETSRTIDIRVNDDKLVESNETFQVLLSNPTGGATLGDVRAATVTIIDNDRHTASIQFKTAIARVAESGKTVALTVTRTGDASKAATVHYHTANGTAQAGRDYTAASGTLTFKAKETSKTIKINVKDDKLVEGNEQFRVVLSDPKGGAALGPASTATVTIVDNDRPTKSGMVRMATTVALSAPIRPTPHRMTAGPMLDRFPLSKRWTGLPALRRRP